MRLTCPNCGAQYEVPDEVIPSEGRDVQCSNCGDTWYQNHPDIGDSETKPAQEQPEDFPQPEPEPDTDDIRAALGNRPPAQERAQQQEVPAGVSDILREEAQREAQLRAAETATPLESQPDLGLDNMPADEPARRAREASDRMARIKGQSAAPDDPAADAGSRRELLPDIEEINSSLRASDEGTQAHTAVGPARATRQKKSQGGFARGFALIVIIGVVLALIYANAATISGAIPPAEPALNAYVALVDQARVWLDAQLGAFTPRPEE